MYEKTITAYEKRRILNGKLTPQEEYDLGKAIYSGRNDYKTADSIFQGLIKMDSTYVPAYIYRARCNYKMDTNNEKWMAFPFYLKVTEIIKPEDRQSASKKTFALESLRYVADYYSKSADKDLAKAKSQMMLLRRRHWVSKILHLLQRQVHLQNLLQLQKTNFN